MNCGGRLRTTPRRNLMRRVLFLFSKKCRHLFEILDSRERRKSTVLVSQIPVKEWYDLFKDCTYADACLDRVLCKAYRLEFKGESLRNQKF